MILYNFIKNFGSVSEDTSDNIFDVVVTVVWDKDCDKLVDCDFYYNFCKTLYSKVVLKEVNKYNVWIVCYSDLIKNNLPLFKDYSKKYWKSDYAKLADDDEDEFIYTWVDHFHYLLSGEIGKKTSERMIELLNKCEVIE